MLFNSLMFILVFAPITYGVLALVQKFGARISTIWLSVASLAFYGWTEAHYLPLLLVSMFANYLFGICIMSSVKSAGCGDSRWRWSQIYLWVGLVFNIGILSYYKYSGFFVMSLESIININSGFVAPQLPIGISFFTFTQIAFLVDSYFGKVADRSPFRYVLFVSYFPHLIAGPILHHGQMMPQFAQRNFGRICSTNVFIGLFIFVVGLIKKVVLADGVAQFVGPVFDFESSDEAGLSQADAWIGISAYTLQLYFDFSGYSDMAIGLSKIMGVTLPENFRSPYKARSISEFWRRWHISLSNFLRDYLYIPLGGNRSGIFRRYLNLLATMILGGLWHGASWTFLAWGALHGMYLVVNNLWARFTEDIPLLQRSWLAPVYWVITLIAVMVGWVFFRSASFEVAFAFLQAMFGQTTAHTVRMSYDKNLAALWIGVCAVIALFFPNTLEIRRKAVRLLSDEDGSIRVSIVWAGIGVFAIAIPFFVLIAESAFGRSPFIYFSF